jgi:predicted CxxxxCH...CXXCH cytochrome family protein
MSERRLWLFFSWLLVALAAGLGPGCLDARSSAEHADDATQCARCHGDPNRAGTREERAAPPTDLNGNTDSSYPGVGAHQIHLNAGSTHPAFACSECHLVPKHTEDKGHADSAAPAELTFGALATHGSVDGTPHSPKYDSKTRNCSDTYCHRGADEVWTAPRDSATACGTCHSLPPPAPHPQSDRCNACHAEVVDESRNIIDPNLHVDGKVEQKVECNLCHGSPASAAPPVDLSGNTATTALGVGAHQAHLAGGAHSRKVDCTECHLVPKDVSDPNHLGPPPAELTFSGVAIMSGRTPSWDRSAKKCSDAWCHSPDASGGLSPDWTSQAGDLPCTGCHQTPPPPPHPQMDRCALCHGDVVNADNVTMKNRDLHVDGEIEVTVPKTCNGCHGSATNNAPPQDAQGNTETTFSGVGAHQSHLVTAALDGFRPVPCEECHIVPTAWSDPGHLDTPRPAELAFSGAAVAFLASPSYANGKCANTHCHGGHFPGGNPSGGTITEPTWTAVDGTITGSCSGSANACHALPPLTNPFHTPSMVGDFSACPSCHNMNPDGTHVDPNEHANGKVD